MEETEQDHRHFEEAAPIYATGGLEPKEREAFEAHLESGCTVCFEVLKELQPTTEFELENPELVHAETLQKIPEHTPPTDDIRTPHTIPEPTESSKGIWPKVQAILTSGVLAVVLVLVAAGAIWFAVSGQTDLSGLVEERQLLELDVKELSQRMERLQDQIKEQANLVGEIRTLQEGPPDESLHDGEPSNDPNPATERGGRHAGGQRTGESRACAEDRTDDGVRSLRAHPPTSKWCRLSGSDL